MRVFNWLLGVFMAVVLGLFILYAVVKYADARVSTLANIQYRLGDFAGASANWSKLIASHPTTSAYYYDRGLSRKALNDHAGAISDWSKAIELDPKDPDAYVARSSYRLAKGDFDGAIAD